MTPRPWVPNDIRTHHRGLILSLLDHDGPMTRSQIARRVGLSVPSTTAIVADLTAAGCLTEIGLELQSKHRGRRGAELALAHRAYVVAGVSFDVGRLEVGLCDLSGSMIASAAAAFQPAAGAGAALETALSLIPPLLPTAGVPLIGVGVAVPGAVDAAHRSNVRSMRLGWQDVAIAERFESALGVATVVEYNVRAMALAQARSGRGTDAKTLLYVHVGTGVGIACVIDGQLNLQWGGGVPELGHHRLASTPTCACGAAGCLEALIAEPYLRARVAQAARRSRTLATALRVNHTILDALDSASRSGDTHARDILARFVEHLTDGLAIAVNLLSPVRVVLGGMLAQTPCDMLREIGVQLRTKTCQPLRGQVRLERSTLDPYPGVLGAAAVALDSFFFTGAPPRPRSHRTLDGTDKGAVLAAAGPPAGQIHRA